jgi:hypothetical protein
MSEDVIDLLSLDEAAGFARLHLVVEGDWPDYEAEIDRIRRRLNAYIHYVTSGQLAMKQGFAGRPAKFIVSCETAPPALALLTFSRMKRHLASLGIGMGVTVGRDLDREVNLPESDDDGRGRA